MSSFDGKGINVEEYDSIDDYKITNSEVIEIKNFNEKDIEKAIKLGFFYAPSKITYRRKTEEIILSKRKRQYIKKWIKENPDIEIIRENPVTNESYSKWYKEVYVPEMKSKKHGKILAKEDWAKTDNETLGVFFKIKDKMIAGAVGRSYPKEYNLPERFSISYYATREKDTTTTYYLNIKMIDFAKEKGYKDIFIGKDTNLYGKHLSTGIVKFKISLGYKIEPLTKYPNMLIKLNNLKEFDEEIFLVSYDKKEIIGNIIFKENVKDTEAYKKGIDKINILTIEQYHQ